MAGFMVDGELQEARKRDKIHSRSSCQLIHLVVAVVVVAIKYK